MTKLRERLRGEWPDLYASLDRSWTIAREEWLPAIGPALDSFNSYPHLRNLEGYLDRVVAEYETATASKTISLLSPLETYVMLAAILFHDIGRAVGGGAHGEKSKQLVQEKHASLGIPSSGLADSLGRIVAFHDLSPAKAADTLRKGELRTVVVSPYGEIRERVCAALLLLVDHLDAAFTRVVPVYVRDPGASGAVGAFRRAVQGVHVDLRSQTAVVVLSGDLKEARQQSSESDFRQYKFTANMEFLCDQRLMIATPSGNAKLVALQNEKGEKGQKGENGEKDGRTDGLLHLFRMMKPKGPDLDVSDWFWDARAVGVALKKWDFGESQVLPDGGPNPLFAALNQAVRLSGDRLWAIARGFVRVRPNPVVRDYTYAVKALRAAHARPSCRSRLAAEGISKFLSAKGKTPPADATLAWWLTHHALVDDNQPGTSNPWLSQLLLAIILGDTWANAEALAPVQSILTAVGVPIKSWLLEFDEHLYNRWGQETYEPIFNRDYLERVAKAMWELSVTVFAHDTFAYETLAAQLRDPDVERVRRAVRRLSIACSTRSAPAQNIEGRSPIWLGRDKWRWDVRPRGDAAKVCDYVSLAEIEARLRLLRSPEGRPE